MVAGCNDPADATASAEFNELLSIEGDVGTVDGAKTNSEGTTLGRTDGSEVEGELVGSKEGSSDGVALGRGEGKFEGRLLGSTESISEGSTLGKGEARFESTLLDGRNVGRSEGTLLESGSDVGATEGGFVVDGVGVVVSDFEEVCSDNKEGLIVGRIDVGTAVGATEGSLVGQGKESLKDHLTALKLGS